MILTQCAACAKPLEHDASSRCVGCQTRYCSDRCLRYHAHRGGHDDECEDISNGGGAEQYHADKKYKEAVAVAVEACAEDKLSARADEMHDPNKGMADLVKFFAAIKPYDGGN